jgi:dTDP-glucose 4,6-dehydratase
MKSKIFKDHRFLVTGGLGFIGSNFILHTLNKYPKCRIANCDAEFIGSNKKNLEQIKNKKGYCYFKGNINNKKLTEKLVRDCDVVFNFAAESHVDRSIDEPKPFFDSNIMGTYTILEAVRKFDKKLVHISTDEVFGSLKSGSATEKYPFNPSSPYAASKASAELLINSYFTTYGIDATITRCTNNYGPRQFPEKLIPKTILLAIDNKRIPVYGTGKNRRDWIFVFDHCEAILEVFEKGKKGSSYNIAGHSEYDNNTIVKMILQIMKKPSDLIKHVKDRPGHDFRYSLDTTKIRREIGWKPKVTFEQGLYFTISWYLNNMPWLEQVSQKSIGRTK